MTEKRSFEPFSEAKTSKVETNPESLTPKATASVNAAE